MALRSIRIKAQHQVSDQDRSYLNKRGLGQERGQPGWLQAAKGMQCHLPSASPECVLDLHRALDSGLLLLSHRINKLQQRQSLPRVHTPNRRIAVSRSHHPTITPQYKLRRLNVISSRLPPGADQIRVCVCHAICHRKAEVFSDF